MKKYVPFFIIMPLFLLTTYSSILLYLYNDKELHIAQYKEQKIQLMKSQYELVIASHIKVTDAMFGTLINKQHLLEIFAKAHTANEEEKALILQRLHPYFFQLFSVLSKLPYL